ncbi:hypothetical protein I552_1181 [Mycobacterium xenopi 3993]|nr:hypothetical protein I552_1181 [Mycobacterium xenopi 3993]
MGAPRQFGSTEHLSTEAIAAFVDGELRMNAHLRAAHHLSLCAQCAAEVEDQSRARAALRDSQPIRIPAPCSACWPRFLILGPIAQPGSTTTSRDLICPTNWLMAARMTGANAGRVGTRRATPCTRLDRALSRAPRRG